MGALSWQHLLIVLIIVLVLFGGSRLAGLGKSTGRALREFKEETKDLRSPKADETANGTAISTGQPQPGQDQHSAQNPQFEGQQFQGQPQQYQAQPQGQPQQYQAQPQGQPQQFQGQQFQGQQFQGQPQQFQGQQPQNGQVQNGQPAQAYPQPSQGEFVNPVQSTDKRDA